MPKRPRQAFIFAFTVEVSCPNCQECVPAPNGSHFWTIQDLESKDQAEFVCDACDEVMIIAKHTNARISYSPPALSDAS